MMQIYNIKRNWNILIYILLFGMNVHAQNKGFLIDAQTKTPLAQVNLLWIDIGVAAASNDQGEFIIPNHLPSPAQLKISCVGYGTNIVLYRPDLQLTIELEPSHIQLHEMTVSAVTGVLQKNNISNVERRGMDELKHIQAVNIGQAMANIPGVYNSSTGNGISKPVIRGLSGMRVVTYWQGLRIENQQWGGDHGLGMGEVGLGEVEIVKGPSSLLYGADALGGVVYFLEEPYAAQDQIEGFVESIYDENTLGSKNLAGIKVANHSWRLNVFGSYNNQADFEVPSKEYVQNSRWKEQVLKASLGYHNKKYVGNLRYQFLQQRIGIPGHTHDSIVDVTTFLVDNQKRSKTIPAQTIQNHYALWENLVHWSNNELKLLAGYTQNTLQEYEEKITIPGIDVTLSNASVQLQWKKTFSEAMHWIVGTQNMLQRNQNSSKASTFLLPDAQTFDYGIYSLVQG
jgi:iron complex outermembrane receptor protein